MKNTQPKPTPDYGQFDFIDLLGLAKEAVNLLTDLNEDMKMPVDGEYDKLRKRMTDFLEDSHTKVFVKIDDDFDIDTTDYILGKTNSIYFKNVRGIIKEVDGNIEVNGKLADYVIKVAEAESILEELDYDINNSDVQETDYWLSKGLLTDIGRVRARLIPILNNTRIGK